MTTPGKSIVIRNQRKQRWENSRLSGVLCERNKEIASLRSRITELVAEIANHREDDAIVRQAERERIALKMLDPDNPFDWNLNPEALREWLSKP